MSIKIGDWIITTHTSSMWDKLVGRVIGPANKFAGRGEVWDVDISDNPSCRLGPIHRHFSEYQKNIVPFSVAYLRASPPPSPFIRSLRDYINKELHE